MAKTEPLSFFVKLDGPLGPMWVIVVMPCSIFMIRDQAHNPLQDFIYIWSATRLYPSLSLIWWWWYPDNYHDVMFNIDLWSATWTLLCLSVLALRALGICNLINYSRSVWWSKNQENINIMITTMIIIHDDLCSPPGPWLMNRRPLSDTVDWETSNTCNII